MESIVSGLIRALAPLATSEATLLWNYKDKVLRLQEELDLIKAVLSDAEEKEHREKQVQTWLQKLREVAYDASDVFDEVNMECALHPELVNEADVGLNRHFVRLVSACFLSCFTDMPNPIVFRHRMGWRIEDIMAKFDNIKKMREGLLGIGGSNQSESSNRRETCSSPAKDQPLLGRDEDKQQLIKKLCASDDVCIPVLVSIVGMGGVGKTTIARAVYNGDEINEHFSVRKWVFVGEKFDVRRIVEEILSEPSKQEIGSGNRSLENLHTCLISKIRDKKFLIVLDDVWEYETQEWERLWCLLTYGAKGSKVLITTRDKKPVEGRSSFIRTLKCLSDDDCQSIFEKTAFVDGSSEGHPVLKEIGKEIVKKLKGLPLAAKLIGGALIGNVSETDWRRLLDSDIWSHDLNTLGVLPSLRLSYQALPSRLKLCFQFCSLFPKDHRFYKETLLRMWTAHDYIKPIGGERVEDAGSRYFDELLHRSFFQYINYSYVMHDLIHDLAQFVSDGQCSRVEDKNQVGGEQFNRIHHLSLFCEGDLEPKDLHQFNKTRTLLHIRGNLTVASDAILCQLLGRLRCVRVLSLIGFDKITSLPECISNLKHLRYLDLSRTSIKKLPESLCTLYNLQTLMLPNDNDLLPPKGMSKLVNLRNLNAPEDYCSKIAGIGKLTCLQELHCPFKVSKKKSKGHNIGELKGMNQLRGRLRIANLENVTNVKEAEGFPLKDKVFLHRLELSWKRGSENEYSDSSEDGVIEALQPPQQLKEMILQNHPDSQPPSRLPLLSNLVKLELYYCTNYTYLPSALGRLPCLTSLELVGMSGIKQVGPEFHCCGNGSQLPCGALLPRLRRLHFERCPKLSTISGLLRHHNLNTLEEILILGCEELVQLLGDGEEGGKGNLPLLQALVICECPKLAWSEVEPLILASSSTTFTALSIYPDDEQNWNVTLLALASKEYRPHRSVGTNTRELLSWLLQPKRNLLKSLKRLEVNNCDELTSFTVEEEQKFCGRNLPSLLQLSFCRCPNLRSLPAGLRHVSSLKQLLIMYCPHILALTEWVLPPTLRRLTIRSCLALHSVLAVPPMLESLFIHECPHLAEVMWGGMQPDLIGSSNSLPSSSSSSSSSTETLAPRLEYVETDNRRLLSWLLLQPWRLEFLQTLKISDCEELMTFTDEEKEGWRRNLPSLTELCISRCPNLCSLPKVKHIKPEIVDCPKLQHWGCGFPPLRLQH